MVSLRGRIVLLRHQLQQYECGATVNSLTSFDTLLSWLRGMSRAPRVSLLRQGIAFVAGFLTFQGFPEFKPNLTPKQVIQAHSFGG